jgi:hypothetical protein
VSAAGEDVLDYLAKRLAGDWGDLSAADKAQNELSLREGFRILSAYTLSSGTRLWIITEAEAARRFCSRRNIDAREQWRT